MSLAGEGRAGLADYDAEAQGGTLQQSLAELSHAVSAADGDVQAERQIGSRDKLPKARNLSQRDLEVQQDGRLTAGQLRELFDKRRADPAHWSPERLGAHLRVSADDVRAILRFAVPPVVRDEQQRTLGYWCAPEPRGGGARSALTGGGGRHRDELQEKP